MKSYQIIVQLSWYVFCFAIGALIEYFNFQYHQILYRIYKKLVIRMKRLDSKVSFFTKLAILIFALIILGHFISINYELVNIALAGFLLLATYQYALLTQDLVCATNTNTQLSGELVSETNKMRKAQTQPNVYVAIQPADELNYIVEFFIQNIGLGPAYNVKIRDPPVFQYAENKFLSDISLVKNEIKFLAPKQKMQIFMMDKSNVFKFNPEVPITIKLEYKDFEGENIHNDYEIDFSLVLDVQRMKYIYTDFESNLLSNAEKINKSLNSISSNIETISDNSIFNKGLIQSDSCESLAVKENYERQVEIAKFMVKNALFGFCNDWKSYKDCNQFLGNPDPGHIVFISHDQRLLYHLDKFIFVSRDIDAMGVLPKEVSDKLIDFASRMRIIVERSNQSIGPEVWGRKNPSSVVNLLDNLLADAKDMYENLDNICIFG